MTNGWYATAMDASATGGFIKRLQIDTNPDASILSEYYNKDYGNSWEGRYITMGSRYGKDGLTAFGGFCDYSKADNEMVLRFQTKNGSLLDIHFGPSGISCLWLDASKPNPTWVSLWSK